MQNCYQYLLTVAEKIICEFADQQTIEKYSSLKAKLLSKMPLKTQTAFSTLSKDNIKYQVLKTSSLDENVKNKSRCSSRKSTSKSKPKQNGQLSRARLQSYYSKATEESVSSQRQQEYSILLHVATLIKNAQNCPAMLKTITFSPNSFSVKANNVIQSIATSLTNIYNNLVIKDNNGSKQLNQQCLIKDNKWLLGKLESMVDENSTLRRMVGYRVY